MHAPPRGWLATICTLALTGCAINPQVEIDRLASGPVVLDVPNYPQTENQCGPAALAGVLTHSSVEVSPEAISDWIYLPGREGSLQPELLAATRRAGRIPVIIGSEPSDLVRVVEGGSPVLVLLNLATRGVPYWHYAVVVGLQPPENRVLLNSGRNAREEVPAGRFMRQWNWAGNWGFVVVRPGEIPAAVSYRRYAEAVAAFEAVAADDTAQAAWRAALQRWPEEAGPHLALGNRSYREGKPEAALIHYRAGLAIDEADPALVNNAASVLGELGCADPALRLLDPLIESLEPESPWREVLLQTSAELKARPTGAGEYCGY